MAYWKDSLLVGVAKIDDQHKKLIRAIDALMKACAKGQGRTAIEKTLDFTIDYTKIHFADEERLQAEVLYPDIVAHKRLHTNFIASISTLKTDLDAEGPTVALVSKINKTLVDWLINHISIEDKKIGEYIKSNK